LGKQQVQKKGQITLFVVLGIALLGIIITFLVFMNTTSENTQYSTIQTLAQDITDTTTLTHYVESCLDYISERAAHDVLAAIPEHTSLAGTTYDNEIYPFACTETEEGCINHMLSRQFLEQALNKEIEKQLPGCLTFEPLEKRGARITEGKQKITTDITDEEITITLDFPITITDDITIKQDAFVASLTWPLGRMLDMAHDILNHRITEGYDDRSLFLTDLQLTLHKPYPHTLYRIEAPDAPTAQPLVLRFAAQGEESILDNSLSIHPPLHGFCITPEGHCYANTEEDICLTRNGTYRTEQPASCKTAYLPEPCTDCQSCGIHAHGESWCEYDTATGASFDGAGARHATKTCVNGVITTDPCRDYREELCAQEEGHAACRINRYHTCYQQRNEADCEAESRDCVWNDFLYKAQPWRLMGDQFADRKCSPQVTPGLPFWDQAALQICSIANEQAHCGGYNELGDWDCDPKWVDSTAVYCYSMGDCGDYFNIDHQITKGGFYNTQSDYTDALITRPRDRSETASFTLELPIDVGFPSLLAGDEYFFPESTEPIMQSLFGKYRSWIQERKPKIIYEMTTDAFVGKTPIRMDFDKLHSAYCGPWQPPKTGDCSACNADDLPCSQYRCRSIAASCTWDETTRLCSSGTDAGPAQPLTIQIAEAGGHTFSRDYFMPLGIEGITLQEPVVPYTAIPLSISANNKISCHVLPESPILGRKRPLPLPSTTISRLSLIVPTVSKEAEELAASITFDSPLEMHTFHYQADSVNVTINDAQRRFQQAQEAIAILLQQDRGIRFMECFDGESYATTFVIYQTKNDTRPPDMHSGRWKDNRISITLSEPAECRYAVDDDLAFENMPKEMDCATDAAASFTGEYACSATQASGSAVYIRCKDAPPLYKEYALTLQQGEENTTLTGISYNGTTAVIDLAFYQKHSSVSEVIVNASQAMLTVSFEEHMLCDGADFSCKRNSNTTFICTADVPIDGIAKTYAISCAASKDAVLGRNTNFNSFVLRRN
jgi:hypothetical protein